MKKCPFCAEEIQHEAIKCKHCGEWLKEIAKVGAPSPPDMAPHVNHSSVEERITTSTVWKEIPFVKLLIYIALIPAALVLLDAILGFTFHDLSGVLPESGLRLILYIFYVFLGISIAGYIYKLRKLTLIVGLSFIVLFFYRFLLVVFFYHEFIKQAMISTAIEGVFVYVSLSLCSLLLRYFEPRFDYAEITNIFESNDPITGKKYDTGTCSKCGSLTVIGKARSHRFLGKSSQYFCDSCNRFLRGNPLNNVFLGLTEAVSSALVMLGIVASRQRETSSYRSMFMLLLFVGIYDGIVRLSYGISGVKSSSRKSTTALESKQSEGE